MLRVTLTINMGKFIISIVFRKKDNKTATRAK